MKTRFIAGLFMLALLTVVGCDSGSMQSGSTMSVPPKDSGTSAGAPKPGSQEKVIGEGGGKKIGK